MAKRRLKPHTRRGLNRRKAGARKPMSSEQKAINKKVREAQSAADKARISKKE